MDAHDIFRKLTKGVKFTKKKSQPHKQLKDRKPEIKKEPEDDFKTESGSVKNGQIADNIEDGGLDLESEFNLLENVAVVQNKKKAKAKISPEKLKEMQQLEEISSLRNLYRISVIGKKVPPPIKTFTELETDYNVSMQLIKNLTINSYTSPTPIQMQSIPIMFKGRSLMACAPTGSGKTVAFLTPVIRDLKEPQRKGFRALVLCPTRELAKQTQRECLRLTEFTGLKTHLINKAQQAEQKFGPNSSKKFDILVSTPNRICYLLKQTPSVLDLSSVEWLIVDEADKLMEEGINSFKEQFDQILASCTNAARKVALFSATYTVPVAKWAHRHLKGLIKVTIGERNAATDLVEQELLFVGSELGKLLALRDLVRSGLHPPVLIFVQSKDRAKQLFNELIYDGINVDVIHADRTQQQRDNVVRAFREGKIWVLICTELMGRGIDFKGVNLVVNYDFPPTTISYIHRIGRSGRAGRSGKAITYFTQDDTPNLRSIAQIIKNSGGKVPDFMLSMKKVKKAEKKKLARKAPDREDISTMPKFEKEKKDRLKKAGDFARRTPKNKEAQVEGQLNDMKKQSKKEKKRKNIMQKE